MATALESDCASTSSSSSKDSSSENDILEQLLSLNRTLMSHLLAAVMNLRKTKQTTRMVFYLRHLRNDMRRKFQLIHGKSRDCNVYCNINSVLTSEVISTI